MYDGEQSNVDAPPPEESSNRTFLIVAGILGGIVLLSLACVAAYVVFVLPGTQKAQQAAVSTQNAQNAAGGSGSYLHGAGGPLTDRDQHAAAYPDPGYRRGYPDAHSRHGHT